MKKIIRYSIILLAFVLVIVVGSCSTVKMSVPLPPPTGGSEKPYRVCKENELHIDCKLIGPTATGADRGFQETQKELP